MGRRPKKQYAAEGELLPPENKNAEAPKAAEPAEPGKAVSTQRASAAAAPPMDPFTALARELAFSKDANIEVVERLVALKERTQDREARFAFDQAHAAMQEDLPVIARNGAILNKQGKVQSRYSRWEDIHRIVVPILRKHGFSLRHSASSTPTTATVTSILSGHGHAETSSFTLGADMSGSKNSAQGIASSAGYAKRHNTILLANINTSDDDDAVGAAPDREQARLDNTDARIGKLADATEQNGGDEETENTEPKSDAAPARRRGKPAEQPQEPKKKEPPKAPDYAKEPKAFVEFVEKMAEYCQSPDDTKRLWDKFVAPVEEQLTDEHHDAILDLLEAKAKAKAPAK